MYHWARRSKPLLQRLNNNLLVQLNLEKRARKNSRVHTNRLASWSRQVARVNLWWRQMTISILGHRRIRAITTRNYYPEKNVYTSPMLSANFRICRQVTFGRLEPNYIQSPIMIQKVTTWMQQSQLMPILSLTNPSKIFSRRRSQSTKWKDTSLTKVITRQR